MTRIGWSRNLFVVQTVGYRHRYVLFFARHGGRELVRFKVTSNPSHA